MHYFFFHHILKAENCQSYPILQSLRAIRTLKKNVLQNRLLTDTRTASNIYQGHEFQFDFLLCRKIFIPDLRAIHNRAAEPNLALYSLRKRVERKAAELATSSKKRRHLCFANTEL